MLILTKMGWKEININDFITDKEYYTKILSLRQEL
jgi:hypothetical protein